MINQAVKHHEVVSADSAVVDEQNEYINVDGFRKYEAFRARIILWSLNRIEGGIDWLNREQFGEILILIWQVGRATNLMIDNNWPAETCREVCCQSKITS